MRVLVTGGSGFLGGKVLPELHRRGHDVVALARSTAAADKVAVLGAEALSADLDDPASLDEAFPLAKAEALVNLASLGFGHAAAIVAAAEEAGIARALFISTTAIFTTLPAASRAVRVEAEDAIRASALEWTIVRPTMIYGAPGDRNMERLIKFLRRSPVVPLPDGGKALMQPVQVEDLAWFICEVLDAPEARGAAYDVAGPEALSLREVVEISAAALGRRPRLVTVPLGPVTAAARLYERLARRPRLRAEQLERLGEDKAFDIGAATALGYRPRPFAEGIAAEAAMLR
ncbi:MAG: SDR family oxidoreductase [Acidimicrobiales bacterium]